MEARLIEKNELDSFLSKTSQAQLLQSWSWGEFQKKAGHQVWRFGVFNNDEIIASAQIIEHKLKLNLSYLYCPRGPMVDSQVKDKNKILELILSKARDITIATDKQEEIFFRFEPTFNFTGIKAKKSKSIQPADTLIIDLKLSQEELLKNFHQKTRYNIKVAEKHNIKIEEFDNDNFEGLWPIFDRTAKRDNFNLHKKEYYLEMVKQVEIIKIFVASGQAVPIAVAICGFIGDTLTYLHGASNYEFRNLMAPYSLHWKIMKLAKEQGFKYYDLHGITMSKKENHSWYGFTRFKKGFGGTIINYPGTYDFIYSKIWYLIYLIFRVLNKII